MLWTCQLTYHAIVKPAMKCVTREDMCLPGWLDQGPRTLKEPHMELLSSSFLGSCQAAVRIILDEARIFIFASPGDPLLFQMQRVVGRGCGEGESSPAHPSPSSLQWRERERVPGHETKSRVRDYFRKSILMPDPIHTTSSCGRVTPRGAVGGNPGTSCHSPALANLPCSLHKLKIF